MSTYKPPRASLLDFKAIKSRVSILDVLDYYGLTDTLKRTSDRLSGPCPLHHGTNPTHFRVSLSRNCFNCFGSCGRGGNIIDFVSLREGIPFRDAALLLQQWFISDSGTTQSVIVPLTPTADPPDPPQNASAETPNRQFKTIEEAGENPPLSFELKALKTDHAYLSERGLTQETIADYGIGYCSRGCLRGHVVIPIRNINGQLTGYIGRWPGDPPEGQGKYKLPKGFHKSSEVFNIDRAMRTDVPLPLLVVEGVFDCLHLIQLGYGATIALLGSSLSSRQEILIREAAKGIRPVYLLFDADEAGRKGAAEAASRLCHSCAVRIIDIGAYQPQPELLEIQQLECLLSGNLAEDKR